MAKRDGLTVAATFTEEKSAKGPGRPVFSRMIERLHAGEAEGIICWKLDRLARNPVDGGTVSWMLQQGVIQHIQTYERGYLPTDNVLMMQVEFGMANQFVRDLSTHTKRGMRHKVSEGWMPHKPPIGYLNNIYKDPTKPPLYKDPERFDLVRKLWDTILEKKYSIKRMTQVAFEIGLRTHKGKRLGQSKIHYVLTNPFYYGAFRWKDEVCQGKHEPIITKAEFEAVQRIIHNRYKAQPHYKQFAFTGLMRCGECGAGITAETKTKTRKDGSVRQYTYYRCAKSVNPACTQKTLREEGLEAQILESLGRIRISPEFHQWAMKRLREEHEKEKADQESVRTARNSAVQQCERKISSLVDLRLAGEIEPEVFKARKDDLLADKKRMEELSLDAGRRVEAWLGYAEEALGFAEMAQERFQTGDMEAKRQILDCLGSSLVLKDRTLKLALKAPLELIGEVAPGVRALQSTLEPSEPLGATRGWDEKIGQEVGWGG